MTPRVQKLFTHAKLRRGSFWMRRTWWGDSLRATAGRPPAVRLALALENLLRNIPIEIQAGELIVGMHPETEPPTNPPAGASLMPSQDPLRLPEERAALRGGVFTSAHKTGHLTPNFRRLLESRQARLNALRRREPEHHRGSVLRGSMSWKRLRMFRSEHLLRRLPAAQSGTRLRRRRRLHFNRYLQRRDVYRGPGRCLHRGRPVPRRGRLRPGIGPVLDAPEGQRNYLRRLERLHVE